MVRYHLTWNRLGKSIFLYFWLLGIILRQFQPGAKIFTGRLFLRAIFGEFWGIFGPNP